MSDDVSTYHVDPHGVLCKHNPHKHLSPEEVCNTLNGLEKELRALRMSILDRKYVDMTPDEGLVERILEAYIDDTQWSDAMPGLEPTNPLCIELNELTVKRNELIRDALAAIATGDKAF